LLVKLSYELLISTNAQIEEGGTAVATILCIEDYSEILEVLQKTLQAAGYHVLAASNGSQGLDLFALNGASINAIVLDLQLPDMTGKEVAILIKKQHAHLPIILFSGCTQDIYLAMPECFDAFVEKTRLGDIPRVLKRLLNAVGRRDLRDHS
jgi:CheY-like chemotaxis protein